MAVPQGEAVGRWEVAEAGLLVRAAPKERYAALIGGIAQPGDGPQQ